MFPSLRGRHVLGSLVVAGIAGSLAVALAGDPPMVLPGIALGSTALLYVEKATACFSSYLLVLVVVVRAFAGDLPSELRGVKYAVQSDSELGAAIRRLTRAEEELRVRIEQMEAVDVADGPA